MWTSTPRDILSADQHRLLNATHFFGNKDEFTVNFKGFAISREKKVMDDLLQYAKELTHEEKIKLDEESTKKS